MLSLDAFLQHQLPASPPSSSASSSSTSFNDAGLSPASCHSQTFNSSDSTSCSALNSPNSQHHSVVIRRPLHYREPARPRARSFVRSQPILTIHSNEVKQLHRTPLQSPLTPPDTGHCECSAPLEVLDVCSRGVFCPVTEPEVNLVYPTGLVAHYHQLSASAHLARMASTDVVVAAAAADDVQAIDMATEQQQHHHQQQQEQQRRQSIQSLRLDTEGLDLGGALPQLSVASHGRAHTSEGVVSSPCNVRGASTSPPRADAPLRSVTSRAHLSEAVTAKSRNTSTQLSASHCAEDSFAAHIRAQCTDTHDIFTSEAMLEAAEKQRTRSSKRPVSREDESQSQVLGGFASLGRAVLPTAAAVAAAASAPGSTHSTPLLGSTMEEKRDSTWTTLVARNDEAHDTLDLLTIEEMGLHSIDVGATSNWDGTRIESDNQVKPLGWSVARSTLRARKWIVAPTSTPLRTSAIRAARAVVVSDHVSSRRANVVAHAAAEGVPIPSVFSDATLLELRFLRAGKGAPECTLLLGSPAAQRLAERSPSLLDTISLAGSASRSRSSTANGSDSLRHPTGPVVTRSASTGRQRALSRCVSVDTLSTLALLEQQQPLPQPVPVERTLSAHPNRSSLPPDSAEVARLLQSRGQRREAPSMEALRALPGEAEAPFADYVFGLGSSSEAEAGSTHVGGASPRLEQELFDPLSLGPASLSPSTTLDSSPVLTTIDPARIAAYQRAAAAANGAASSSSRRGGKATESQSRAATATAAAAAAAALGGETLSTSVSKKDRRLSDWFRKRRATNAASAGIAPIWDSTHAAAASASASSFGPRYMPGTPNDDNFGRGHTSAPVALPSRKHTKVLDLEQELNAFEPVEVLCSPGANDTFVGVGSAPSSSAGGEADVGRRTCATLEPASDTFGPCAGVGASASASVAWSGVNRSVYGQRRRSSSDDNIVLSSSLATATRRPLALSRAAEQAKVERRRHQSVVLGQMAAPRRARVAVPPMPQPSARAEVQASSERSVPQASDVGSTASGSGTTRSVSHSPFLGPAPSLASSSLIDEDLDPGALCMWIPLPLWATSAVPSRYVRVAFVPFAGETSGVAASSPDATAGDTSAFFGTSPAVAAAVGVPAWYRKLAHALSPSAQVSSDAAAPASSSSSLGGPEAHFFAAPRRRTSSVDAFRVTALVVAAPGVDAASLAVDPTLPAPGRFPVVLALCDGGRSMDFVTEGWAALGLEHGPALIQGRDEEGKPTRNNEAAVSPLVGVADLIVAGAAAIMDL